MLLYMNIFFNTLRSDKTFFYGFVIAIILLLLSIFSTLIFYIKLPPFIPLYNQMPWGEARLGTKLQIFIPTAVAIGVLIGNFLFSQTIYTKMPLVSRLLSITTLLIAFLTFLFTLRTLFIII